MRSTPHRTRLSRDKQRDAGFTVIELAIVLAVCAMAATLVLPRFTQARDVTALRGTATQIVSAMRLARSQAIFSNTPQVFAIDLSARKLGVAGSGRIVMVEPGIDVVVTTVRRETRSERRGAIRFLPDGSSSGGRIDLKRGPKAVRIDIDWLTGHVRETAIE